MNLWTILFIGVGVVITTIGAYTFLFNRGPETDERMRQTGLVFFAAGLVLAAFTAFAARTPPH